MGEIGELESINREDELRDELRELKPKYLPIPYFSKIRSLRASQDEIRPVQGDNNG